MARGYDAKHFKKNIIFEIATERVSGSERENSWEIAKDEIEGGIGNR